MYVYFAGKAKLWLTCSNSQLLWLSLWQSLIVCPDMSVLITSMTMLYIPSPELTNQNVRCIWLCYMCLPLIIPIYIYCQTCLNYLMMIIDYDVTYPYIKHEYIIIQNIIKTCKPIHAQVLIRLNKHIHKSEQVCIDDMLWLVAMETIVSLLWQVRSNKVNKSMLILLSVVTYTYGVWAIFMLLLLLLLLLQSDTIVWTPTVLLILYITIFKININLVYNASQFQSVNWLNSTPVLLLIIVSVTHSHLELFYQNIAKSGLTTGW